MKSIEENDEIQDTCQICKKSGGFIMPPYVYTLCRQCWRVFYLKKAEMLAKMVSYEVLNLNSKKPRIEIWRLSL